MSAIVTAVLPELCFAWPAPAIEGDTEQMSRILVIDDEAEVRSVFRDALEPLGHEIIEAGDGDEGLRLAGSVAPDLVITDILMPGKEGLECIQEMRRLNPKLRVIAMSGGITRGKVDVLKLARHLGAQRTLGKPFDLDEMLAAVEAELKARSEE